MSALAPISSALTSAADVPGRAAGLPLVTPSGHWPGQKADTASNRESWINASMPGLQRRKGRNFPSALNEIPFDLLAGECKQSKCHIEIGRRRQRDICKALGAPAAGSFSGAASSSPWLPVNSTFLDFAMGAPSPRLLRQKERAMAVRRAGGCK
jgi:hypothetical protein